MKDWRNMLLDTFEIKRNVYNMGKELMQVRPTEGQSLYKFYFQQKDRIDKLRLAFSKQDIISIIVKSVEDKNITTAADARNFRYCDELASFLYNKIYTSDNSKISQKTSFKHYTKTACFSISL